MTNSNNKYQSNLIIAANTYCIFDINKAAQELGFSITKLPYCLRVLFENTLRCSDSFQELKLFKEWLTNKKSKVEIPFLPARVLMQDFTGIPAIVDLAAMRDAMSMLGDDPLKINPLIPVELVIDHSVQVDYSASNQAFLKNTKLEMARNQERYRFLKWGQRAFNNFKVVPPGTGICHQVNLEYLAKIIYTKEENGKTLAFPDTVVGTDSHTTMINGLSVLGWGVGGIEAEAAMLGQPLPMNLPEVIGVKLVGNLKHIVTATDLVLTITELLRKKGVVGKFVEFFGEGLKQLSLADRATIANMAPEYGATCGFFPIDDETIKYLELTGRESSHIKLVEEYAKSQCLWYSNSQLPEYSEIVVLDLSSIEISLAGPKRPQDRINLEKAAENFKAELPLLAKSLTHQTPKNCLVKNQAFSLSHGSIVIAAITSCTNTSNPYTMIAAGLLAKKAWEAGLRTKPYVKTSLAPGSQVVTKYLKLSGLDQYLDNLGFNLVGYGCTTCIGNSGPLAKEIEETIVKEQLVVTSILSGNRNFEGRIHALVRSNYLASPPLVLAYAIAGNIGVNLTTEPLGHSNNKAVYLRDIWPTQAEIKACVDKFITPDLFKQKYRNVLAGDESWQALQVLSSNTYDWDNKSTYINNPPYFVNIQHLDLNLTNIKAAKILAILGDSITTDHISPAGHISINSPAASYLISHNVEPKDFNSYGARRGNHEVMIRGTFANNRIINEMCPGTEGGFTINQLNKQQMSIYEAAMNYKQHSIPLVIFAGKEYGTGSSRDWAAKGASLLGLKAVIAESFERIHRANLVGMGVLPLTFNDGITRKDLMLDGSEEVAIQGIDNSLAPYQVLNCVITKENGSVQTIKVTLQAFTAAEIEYIKYGSIMHKVLYSLKGRSGE